MTRLLSFRDAAAVLGKVDARALSAVDNATGGLLLGASITAPSLLALLGPKNEFVRLTKQLMKCASKDQRRLSRYSRTERVQAAHSIIVVVSFFEALQDTPLPFRFKDLRLTRLEQLAVSGNSSPATQTTAEVVHALLDKGITEPEPHDSYEGLLRRVKAYHLTLSQSIAKFVEGLAIFEDLPERQQNDFSRAVLAAANLATDRYSDMYLRLMDEFPEIAWWAGRGEHNQTRKEIAKLTASLGHFEAMLASIATESDDSSIFALREFYRKAMSRPIIDSADTPGGLRLPSLERTYVSPCFRVAEVTSEAAPSDETWWSQMPLREDLEEFLAGFLTSPRATRAPLLVLGQPGSGKSVLTMVLPARLPSESFLPLRVVLRDAPIESDLQDQLEWALRAATGESPTWPSFVRSAPHALPVAILDGFDELLQATGVSQTDYLTKVSRLQQREADQGRPLAVIVTSRTSVADRAKCPEETLAMRIEPFDLKRVSTWLTEWNRVNAQYFTEHNLKPLSSEMAWLNRDLAEQPLLLLMLALYDADSNALHSTVDRLSRAELYTQLLHSFARREVSRIRPGVSDSELDMAAESELRLLSIVAFGMFNRGSQWITTDSLEFDLTALSMVSRASAMSGSLRFPLRTSDLLVGRFFFIHKAQATSVDSQLQTYEFLHATFGEFLVARFIWTVAMDILARESASAIVFDDGTGDGLLHTLLSFTPISVRPPIVVFFKELLETRPSLNREALNRVLVRLFRTANMPRMSNAYASYLPVSATSPLRCASYAANLLLLSLSIEDCSIRRLFDGSQNPVSEWRAQAMLWHSQFSQEEWRSLINLVQVNKGRKGEASDVSLNLNFGEIYHSRSSPAWLYIDKDPDKDDAQYVWSNTSDLEQAALGTSFECDAAGEMLNHVIRPLADELDDGFGCYFSSRGRGVNSVINILLSAWVSPTGSLGVGARETIYDYCAKAISREWENWDRATYLKYARLLVDRITTDEGVSEELVAAVLRRLRRGITGSLPTLSVIQCCLSALGRSGRNETALAGIARDVLAEGLVGTETQIGVIAAHARGVELWTRLVELGYSVPDYEFADNATLREVGKRYPHLRSRFKSARTKAAQRKREEMMDEEFDLEGF